MTNYTKWEAKRIFVGTAPVLGIMAMIVIFQWLSTNGIIQMFQSQSFGMRTANLLMYYIGIIYPFNYFSQRYKRPHAILEALKPQSEIHRILASTVLLMIFSILGSVLIGLISNLDLEVAQDSALIWLGSGKMSSFIGQQLVLSLFIPQFVTLNFKIKTYNQSLGNNSIMSLLISTGLFLLASFIIILVAAAVQEAVFPGMVLLLLFFTVFLTINTALINKSDAIF